MRRFFLIATGALVSCAGLFALYVVWHPNPNDISPEVDAVSYRALFNQAVMQTSGKSYDMMDDATKLKTLAGFISKATTPSPVREVALFETRNLENKDAAVDLVHKNLASLNPELYEVGVGSIMTIGTPKATAYLTKLYKSLIADPFAHTPMGGYRMSSLQLSPDAASGDVRVRFQELSRWDADYSTNKAREIALLLPANPTHVFAFPNFDDVLTRFNESRFVKTLVGSPVGKDAWTLPLLRSIASLRERLTEDVGFMAQYFSPERLFRDHLLIGNYGGEFLIVTYKDKNLQVAETLMDIYEKLGKDFGVRKSQMHGIQVATVQSATTKKTLSYATVGSYFLVSTDTTLISQSIRTYTTDRGASLAIDPVFNKAYGAIDMTGDKDAAFAWINPSEYFGVIGSTMPAARRLAIVARALVKPIEETAGSTANLMSVPGIIGQWRLGGSEMTSMWKYMTGVRTLNAKAKDGLKKAIGVDLGAQILPYLSSTATFGYAGVTYVKESNSFSRTGFNLVMAIPLRNAPANFDQLLLTMFKRSAQALYQRDSSIATARVWIARDTSTNDSATLVHGLQPSFALTNNGLLVVASTPTLLRAALSAPGNLVGSSAEGYMGGVVRLDSLAVGSEKYLRPYLRSTDKYTPEEINVRLEPMRKALMLYQNFDWTATVGGDGLRRADGKLTARK